MGWGGFRKIGYTMNYNDLDAKQKKQVQKDSGYSATQLEEEDPYLVEDYEIDDYLVDDFADIYGIDPPARYYLDDEKIVQDMIMDMTSIELDGSTYWFHAW